MMDEAEARYLAIRAWWLSSGAASKDAIRDLNFGWPFGTFNIANEVAACKW